MVLGTIIPDRSAGAFHGTQESAKPLYRGPSPLHPVLTITVLPGLIGLDALAGALDLSRAVTPAAFVAENLPGWHPNIKGFPFRQSPVRICLRIGSLSADDQRRENLAPPAAPILMVLHYYYRRDPCLLEVHISSQRCFYPLATPSYRIMLSNQSMPWGIGSGLEPRPFSAPTT